MRTKTVGYIAVFGLWGMWLAWQFYLARKEQQNSLTRVRERVAEWMKVPQWRDTLIRQEHSETVNGT
jgi:hypothetical protein